MFWGVKGAKLAARLNRVNFLRDLFFFLASAILYFVKFEHARRVVMSDARPVYNGARATRHHHRTHTVGVPRGIHTRKRI